VDSGMVDTKKMKYPGVCVPCGQKGLKACDHCKSKNPACANQKEVEKSLCVSCTKERRNIREIRNALAMKEKKIKEGKIKSYAKICATCKSQDQALTECGCCKKPGCTNKNKKNGRNICLACVKKDDSISYGNSVSKKQQGVIFSGRRNHHLGEAKKVLGRLPVAPQGHSTRAPTTQHFVHPESGFGKDSFPVHHYESLQFYNKQLLDKMTQSGVEGVRLHKIRELSDRGMGASLKDCLPMDDEVLKEIAREGERMVLDGLGVDCKFGAAILHVQDLEETKSNRTTVYPGHRDKAGVGDHVMFHQVAGVSFTFIAVGGKESDAQFDKASQGYERYSEWKAFSGNEGSARVRKFEAHVMKKAKAYQTTSVQVYELRAGQSLCFAAAVSYHCSIIPVQVNETRRALLVFHGLEILYTGSASDKQDHQTMTEPVTERGAVAVLTGLKQAEIEPNMKGAKKKEPTIKKCLLLGMAYTETTLPKLLKGREEQRVKMEDVAELVRSKLLAPQDGRDLWRILKMEETYPQVKVYTVAMPPLGDKQELYSNTQHFGNNWNSHYLCDKLKQGEHIFGQICMDYFWMPAGWQLEKITKGFITNTILGFATKQVIEDGCMVVLPFTPHMLALVWECEEQIKNHYDIEYRAKDNTSDLLLYTRTCELEKEKMLSVFDKDMDKQEDYITHEEKSVKDHLQTSLIKGDTFLQKWAKESPECAVESIRFIVLKKKKQREQCIPPTKNMARKRKRGHK
jgi:hypothetical protein